jgi:hypothetical protein
VSTPKGGHFVAQIDAESAQVSPLERRGEVLDLPRDESARRVGGAGGAATCAERQPHADGYAGFNELYRSGSICEVACLAHIRRKFVDVFQSEGSVIAEETIARIAGLYAVEKDARGRPLWAGRTISSSAPRVAARRR